MSHSRRTHAITPMIALLIVMLSAAIALASCGHARLSAAGETKSVGGDVR